MSDNTTNNKRIAKNTLLLYARMLLTMTGSLIICQTVNPMKTVRMELPRYITKGYGFYSIFGS